MGKKCAIGHRALRRSRPVTTSRTSHSSRTRNNSATNRNTAPPTTTAGNSDQAWSGRKRIVTTAATAIAIDASNALPVNNINSSNCRRTWR